MSNPPNQEVVLIVVSSQIFIFCPTKNSLFVSNGFVSPNSWAIANGFYSSFWFP